MAGVAGAGEHRRMTGVKAGSGGDAPHGTGRARLRETRMSMHGRTMAAPRVGGGYDAIRVRRAREAALSGATPQPGSVSEVILESWRRCRDRRVDPGLAKAPLDESCLAVLQDGCSELLEAARPVQREIQDALEGTGAMVLLCNENGVILHAGGAPAVRDVGAELNITPGGVWTEGAAGTNAVGTAITLDRAVLVRNGEHYCDAVMPWTCAASPIHDPLDGRLIGVLDLSHRLHALDDYARCLVISAARRIEQTLDGAQWRREALLVEAGLERAAAHGDGLLLLDVHGRLLRHDARAAEALRAHGIELALERGLALGGTPGSGGAWRPPVWMAGDWVRPVFSGREPIGMLVRIPRPARVPASAASERAEPEGLDPRLRGHRSEAMRSAVQQAWRVAAVDVPVLVEGETGTGKEVVARAIHAASARRGKPFVALNCGAVPRELLASELFGHVEGAFTGARRGGHPGKFEQADGGTIFLDELGELPLDLQPYLLRVLEDGEVVRLGSDRARAVDVRVVAATNRDLRHEMSEGRFRDDLYFRFRVGIRLPPLRERRDDFDRYLDDALAAVAARYGLVRRLSPSLRSALADYDFPGNLRELYGLVEQMAVLNDETELELRHLPLRLQDRLAPAGEPVPQVPAAPSPGMLKEAERRTIAEALRLEQGNRSRAARRLGISRTTLYRRLLGTEG